MTPGRNHGRYRTRPNAARARRAILTAVTISALLGAAGIRPAQAYFEFTDAGARGVALGPSSIVIVDDASAYRWNPAALATLGRPELLIDGSRPYDVSDLSEAALAVAFRAYGTGIGVAWHHVGVEKVYGEDQFCVAAAHTLLRRGGHTLDGGATFKLGRASFVPFTDRTTLESVDFGALTKGSVDAGLRWITPWNVDFAWVARDLTEPRYEFVPGTGGDKLAVRQEFAAGVHWNRESTLSLGWSQAGRGGSGLTTGLEIRFFDVFAVRSSLSNLAPAYEADRSPNDLLFNGGFGVFHHGWRVDASATTAHDLGASYRVTVRVPLAGSLGR